jgi:hypothetical protein
VIRRIIVAILRFTLRIYFRRIEIAGLQHVPKTSPAIFAQSSERACRSRLSVVPGAAQSLLPGQGAAVSHASA